MFYRFIVVAALTLVPQTQALEYVIKTSGNCDVELTESECRGASVQIFGPSRTVWGWAREFQFVAPGNSYGSHCNYNPGSSYMALGTEYYTNSPTKECSTENVCVCGIPPAEVREPIKSEMLAFIQGEQSC